MYDYVWSEPSREKCTHIHGIHGSDNKSCIFCGSTESERKLCEKAYSFRMQEYKKDVKRAETLVKIFGLLDKDESSILMNSLKSEYAGFYRSFIRKDV